MSAFEHMDQGLTELEYPLLRHQASMRVPDRVPHRQPDDQQDPFQESDPPLDSRKPSPKCDAEQASRGRVAVH